jgi:branched-chain amino acid transport system ATP-binding protein
MLDVVNLSTGYASSDVVREVSLDVAPGEAVAVIGSNGAGKTTLFRSVCGLLATSAGETRFEGKRITGMPAQRIARLGISFVPAERHLFGRMSVKDNLSLGAYPHAPDGKALARVLELFPRLAERSTQHAATMSGGEQQMLAVARALMARPRLIILDEPTTGLAPKLAAELYQVLGVLEQQGLTLLVAEQQVPLALGLCRRGYVLENGRIQQEGTSTDLANDPAVRRAYLGVA